MWGLKNFKLGKIQRLDYPDNFFDNILVTDVFYMLHPAGIKEALGECRRCLKDGGHLILDSATYNWLLSRHDLATSTVKRYSAKELSDFLVGSDFKIIRKFHRVFFLFPVTAAVKNSEKLLLLLGSESNGGDLQRVPSLLNLLLTKIMYFEASVLRFVDLPVGTSVFIVARKTT